MVAAAVGVVQAAVEAGRGGGQAEEQLGKLLVPDAAVQRRGGVGVLAAGEAPVGVIDLSIGSGSGNADAVFAVGNVGVVAHVREAVTEDDDLRVGRLGAGSRKAAEDENGQEQRKPGRNAAGVGRRVKHEPEYSTFTRRDKQCCTSLRHHAEDELPVDLEVGQQEVIGGVFAVPDALEPAHVAREGALHFRLVAGAAAEFEDVIAVALMAGRWLAGRVRPDPARIER